MNAFQNLTAQIISNLPVAENIFQLILEIQSDLHALPGQFVTIRTSSSTDPLLRRPLGIAGWHNHQLTLIYKIKGKGTQNLRHCRPGDQLELLFPLGNAFPAPSPIWQNLILIAGGAGLPPLLYYLVYYQKCLPSHTTLFLGSQNFNTMIRFENLDMIPVNIERITQEPSSYKQGLVTDWAAQLLKKQSPQTVMLTCGPEMMMKKMQEMIKDMPNITAFASLEDYMGCGFGVCNGCVHPIQEEHGTTFQKICSEGPIFDLKRIIWQN